MTGSRVLTVIATASSALIVGVIGLGVLVAASEDDEQAVAATWGLGGGINQAVPEAFAPWVLKAGSLCPEFPPAIIAAQIDAESSWNVNAVSSAGAQGPAQFMPGTWAEWGHDHDGNGIASPTDIGDAVMAQGRYDCYLAQQVRSLGGDTTGLALAAYNAGLGAVLRYRGVPPYPQTQQYVPRILALAVKYAAAPTDTVIAVLVAARSQLGVDYSWGGGGPTGPSTGIGRGATTVGFDCSGLVQFAFYQGAHLILPRTANDQARVGSAVNRAQIQPGDVIAFADAGSSTYTHIGIYIGNGQMIHAPQTNDVVKITTVVGNSYWEARQWSIRRYL